MLHSFSLLCIWVVCLNYILIFDGSFIDMKECCNLIGSILIVDIDIVFGILLGETSLSFMK